MNYPELPDNTYVVQPEFWRLTRACMKCGILNSTVRPALFHANMCEDCWSTMKKDLVPSWTTQTSSAASTAAQK